MTVGQGYRGYQADEVSALATLAGALAAAGQHEDARTIYEGLAALLPHDHAPVAALARLSLTTGHVEEALALFAKARALAPKQSELILAELTLALAETHLATGRFADAARELAALLALATPGPGEVMLKRARVLARLCGARSTGEIR